MFFEIDFFYFYFYVLNKMKIFVKCIGEDIFFKEIINVSKVKLWNNI